MGPGTSPKASFFLLRFPSELEQGNVNSAIRTFARCGILVQVGDGKEANGDKSRLLGLLLVSFPNARVQNWLLYVPIW